MNLNDFEFEVHAASEKVYENHLKSAIRNVKNTVFQQLIRKDDFIIPDNIFKWIATDGIYVGLSEFFLLLQKKKGIDNYIDAIKNVCKKKNIENLSFSQLDIVLKDYGLERSFSYRMYVWKYLSCSRIRETTTTKTTPISNAFENLSKNYRNLEQCVDEFICDAAYLANYKILKTFMAALIMENVQYKFQPSIKEHHSTIINWIQKNIYKGVQNPQVLLGWTDGPDSARWPSTELNDYKETLLLLQSLS